MPIFEYQCVACGERFDYLERHSTPAARCPACQSDELKKLISAVAVSSGHTQKRSLDSAKKQVAGQRFDYQYERHKSYHEHDHESEG